jgi:beta-lactamase regulating signal transducer with metallopeptidase domain
MLLASGLLMLILAAAFAVLLVAVADLRAAARTGAAVATLVFVVLLAAGVMGTAERLVPATQARARSKQAGERLASASSDETRQPGRTPALRVTYDRCSLTVSDYRPPDTPRATHANSTSRSPPARR